MNGLIRLISLLAFLLAVSGQFPTLSPSYSFQGALNRSVDGNQTLTAAYSVSVDITRRLQFVDETVAPTAGAVSNNLRLSSENDSATYLSVNNVCTQTAFNPNIFSPININVWDLYANGTESPVGTYTFALGGLTCQITIVNGEPASFTFSFNTTVIAITIANFDNSTPDLSTFSLPSECSQFTCNACYQTNQFPTLSPSYSFQGALVRTVDGTQTLTAVYSVSVDITRRLQFVDETVTPTAGGIVSNNLRLSSENDSATYLSVNNVCTETAFDPNIFSPININVWDLYAAGTESPVGTYTFALGGLTCQITIVNGEPASFTFSFNTTVIAITIANFDNSTPVLSTFSLPSECYKFTCNACYQTNQFPILSPNFSMQGTQSITVNGVQTLTGTFSVSVDIYDGLQFVDETVTTSGVVSNIFTLNSEDDNATYISVDNVCTETVIDPSVIRFPLRTNVWDTYAAGTENSTGIYSFTQNSITHTITIVNREPAGFTISFNTTVITITVTNFDNTTPIYSTFCLPSECSQFTCNFCFCSAVSSSISIMLLLTTLLVYLFTTL